eukprot:5241883-Pyramimonas_sp.AAC.1
MCSTESGRCPRNAGKQRDITPSALWATSCLTMPLVPLPQTFAPLPAGRITYPSRPAPLDIDGAHRERQRQTLTTQCHERGSNAPRLPRTRPS